MADFAQTFSNLWTALDADSAIDALMTNGSKYKFGAVGLMKRFALERALCPIMAVFPAQQGTQVAPAQRDRGAGLEESFAVAWEFATNSANAEAVLDLTQAFFSCIAANIGDGFGLADAGPHDAEYSQVSFEAIPDEKGAFPFWTSTGIVTFRYRIR